MDPVSPFDMKEMELVFPQFADEDKMTESEICVKCHGCCNYVTVPIDAPRSKDRIDNYVWYLLHRNVEIYIDNYKQWFLLFKTPCDKLGTNGFCGIYETRPQVCRDYSATACSRVGKDHTHLFKKPDEFLAFLAEKKKAAASKKQTLPKNKAVSRKKRKAA
ncbi:MAG: YkgJ family cysteine cluster protein [Spirochaetia bacterium]|nr:YkgJ family cysteine cluster protein [Spirochaetia bacterium]